MQRRRPSHKKNDVESKAELKPFRDFGAKGTKSSVYHESWLNPKALTPTKYKKEDKPTTNKRSKKWKKAVDSEEDTGSNSEYSMPVETKAPKKVMSSKGQKEKQKSYVPTKSSTTSLPWRPLAKVNMPQPFPSHTPLFTKSAGLPPAVGNTASKSKDETKKDDKTFTSLTTTVDFDPFGALPGNINVCDNIMFRWQGKEEKKEKRQVCCGSTEEGHQVSARDQTGKNSNRQKDQRRTQVWTRLKRLWEALPSAKCQLNLLQPLQPNFSFSSKRHHSHGSSRFVANEKEARHKD